ncbi:DUF1918 domain-containing protein [Kitasatospora acidiphila]|uniref:DUF1918 domain-containing protein n=1 Tax=Kitasatospora acidiphila TaxID=2567942 RepID=A0A540W2F3_9ACTN|nr:DUF1918 domain-containing protein [Kitasatospora acidiphila]TQF03185.1 DUF1918 domain-containing protein [Kitasatospora acidiphila]
MRADVGDRVHIHSRAVGIEERQGEITEVHGQNGEPPYLVKFSDGHEGLLYPGPDCTIERRAAEER